MPIGPESLFHYMYRERSAYERYADLQCRFPSSDCPEFKRFIDTEGVLFYREIQEVGVPFPYWQDMVTVGGETDLREFLKIGHDCYQVIFPEVASLASGGRVLDFGVGCGRTMRFFYRHCRDFELHGCDVDSSSINHLREEVPFIKAVVSKNNPPLPYGEGFFDYVYCISVFTHFTQLAFREWIAELCRVLKAGGKLSLTLHGPHAFELVDGDSERRHNLTVNEADFQIARSHFASEGFVFANQGVGSSDIDQERYGINFITPETFARLVQPHFDLISYEPGRISNWQDLAVLSKKA
jgi:SAM-dependent methyltransferase